MPAARAWHQARLAAGLVSYLRMPIGPDEALAEARARVVSREPRFLSLARSSIFDQPASPHRALLRWAGWDYARLERAVVEHGLESTLTTLRDEGVRMSLGDFKRGEPIRRDGLLIEPGETTLAAPRIRRPGITAHTSGTASRDPTRMSYDWSLFTEEAAFECLLFEAHGLLGAPHALWLPALPSISGIHNLLIHLRFRSPPERWFSHISVRPKYRPALQYVRRTGQLFGMDLPMPEPAPFGDAGKVADWLARARDRAGAAVLKTFATSAVRVAEAALRRGLDLSGCVVFAGGEPLTEQRTAYIASTGALVFGRYVATETGWIAGACPGGPSPDAMHVCTDRLAVIAGNGDPGGENGTPLLFTTISPGTGKVFLNTDIGDAGQLAARPCGCPLGRAGFELELSGVYGHDKLSVDGMTLPMAALRGELDRLIATAGGAPDSYQLREENDEHGISRLIVVLSPNVSSLSDDELLEALIRRLPKHGPGAELAARFWKDSAAIEVRRDHPLITASMKMTPSSQMPPSAAPRRFDPEEWAAIYESRDGGGGDAFVFRHGIDVARRACLRRASVGEHWVDVGCGTGHLAAALAATGLRVAGVDADGRMVRAAQVRFGNGDAVRKLHFGVAEAERLPFADGTVDGIVATSLVGCLHRPELFFREVERVLRPGGSAVITFTNRTSILHLIGERIRRRNPSEPLEYAGARLYSRAMARRALKAAGLEVDELRYYNCFLSTATGTVPPSGLAIGLERLSNLGGPAGALVGRNLLVVASKRTANTVTLEGRQVPASAYWDGVVEGWEPTVAHQLWRAHSDAVNAELLDRWLPADCGRLLKTDLFDEAVARGLYPELAARATEVIGVDVSEAAVRASSKRYPELAARVASVLALPFADASFDVVSRTRPSTTSRRARRYARRWLSSPA